MVYYQVPELLEAYGIGEHLFGCIGIERIGIEQDKFRADFVVRKN
jgi:hypothetical protein